MYSFLLLVSIWLFWIGLLGKRMETEFRQLLLPVTFIFSCTLLFNINYLLVVNLRSPHQMSGILILLACIFAVITLIFPSHRRAVRVHAGTFFFLLISLLSTRVASQQKNC